MKIYLRDENYSWQEFEYAELSNLSAAFAERNITIGDRAKIGYGAKIGYRAEIKRQTAAQFNDLKSKF